MTEEEQSEPGPSSGSSKTRCRSTLLDGNSSRRRSAYAISDLPLGLLAWNGQLLGDDLDPDFAISNVMLYWLTGTGTSAARLYYENAHVTDARPVRRGSAGARRFRGRLQWDPPVRGARPRQHRALDDVDRGGHFAAHKAPDELIGDIRAFYAGLRYARNSGCAGRLGRLLGGLPPFVQRGRYDPGRGRGKDCRGDRVRCGRPNEQRGQQQRREQ